MKKPEEIVSEIINEVEGNIKIAEMLGSLSKRGREWVGFSTLVLAHIETYTVPQYGDAGEDLCTNYTPEYCVSQIEKYVKRFGKNVRGEQQLLDLSKIAHYAQMAFSKIAMEPCKENGEQHD